MMKTLLSPLQLRRKQAEELPKVVEEHMHAVHEVQLQHLDEDGDVPFLISSSEPESDDDEDPPEPRAARRKQAEEPPDQPSNVPIFYLPNSQKFELYEEDEEEEEQDEEVRERVQACAQTCVSGQNCVAMPEVEECIDDFNSQPDCRNFEQLFSLTVGSKAGVQALVAAHVDPTVVRFVLDSGCTQHIFNGSRANFTNFSSKTQRICTGE